MLGHEAKDAAIVGSDGCFGLGNSGSRFVCTTMGMHL